MYVCTVCVCVHVRMFVCIIDVCVYVNMYEDVVILTNFKVNNGYSLYVCMYV
jgi:hypothetical protein